MNKTLTIPALACLFLTPIATAQAAGDLQCTVVSVTEKQIVLDCGSKVTRLEPGNTVKVKIVRNKEAFNGC